MQVRILGETAWFKLVVTGFTNIEKMSIAGHSKEPCVAHISRSPREG